MKLLSLTLVSLIALGFKEVSGIRSRDYESHEQQLDPQAPVTPA